MEGISRSFWSATEHRSCILEMGPPASKQATFLEKVLLTAGGRCWQDPHESGLGDGSFEDTQKPALDAEYTMRDEGKQVF